MEAKGAVFTIVGALDAFPHRLAAKEIGAGGGFLRRGLSRRTNFAIVGHRLTESWAPARILGRFEAARAAGATLVSENTFLRMLGLASDRDEARTLPASVLIGQSGLAADDFEVLALFDAFDSAGEPHGFRDLVAARQYGRLIAEGVAWPALVRAVRARGRSSDGGLSEVRLERTRWNEVAMRAGEALAGLDGQHLLPLGAEGEDAGCVDRLFVEAEDAEARLDWGHAAALYRRCMALDPQDPIIPFNLSHVLRQEGNWQEARHCLNRVLKLDPDYAEAWYNLAGLARERSEPATARRCLERAIEADPAYPDPVYNLALCCFETGEHAEAARHWTRYLELDPDSDWGEKARQGLKLIAMLAKESRGRKDRPRKGRRGRLRAVR